MRPPSGSRLRPQLDGELSPTRPGPRSFLEAPGPPHRACTSAAPGAKSVATGAVATGAGVEATALPVVRLMVGGWLLGLLLMPASMLLQRVAGAWHPASTPLRVGAQILARLGTVGWILAGVLTVAGFGWWEDYVQRAHRAGYPVRRLGVGAGLLSMTIFAVTVLTDQGGPLASLAGPTLLGAMLLSLLPWSRRGRRWLGGPAGRAVPPLRAP